MIVIIVPCIVLRGFAFIVGFMHIILGIRHIVILHC